MNDDRMHDQRLKYTIPFKTPAFMIFTFLMAAICAAILMPLKAMADADTKAADAATANATPTRTRSRASTGADDDVRLNTSWS